MEKLDRGLVAIPVADGVFISWRLLGNEQESTSFNVYRNIDDKAPIKVNASPISNATCFMDEFENKKEKPKYSVATVIDGKEQQACTAVSVWDATYKSIALNLPEGYRPNDASVGDLDGDGQYELVIHIAARGRDNSQAGMTSPPILQAYKLDGTFLWSINLGPNIREGAHYTQFMVYDFDGDGKAEIACKTADGSIDAVGTVIGNKDSLYVEPEAPQDPTAPRDYRRFRRGGTSGKILKGPEYLTIFEGLTGKAISTVDYIPARHPETLYPTKEQMTAVWGDSSGNRGERYLACVAYLDGTHPSLVMCRGYYTRSVLAAWDFKDKKLVHRWTFDSEDGTPGNKAYTGQGNHNLSVGDVDNDGKDEIIYGACVIDDNGKGLYSTGFGHGDALHFGDLDPTNPGLEIFDIQERFDDAGMSFREAGTGKVLWKKASVLADTVGGDKGEGPGRGCALNIDPRFPGSECWARGAGMHGLYSAKGKHISEKEPSSCNFGIWWDDDLLRELLDGNTVSKWDWEKNETNKIFVAEGYRSINGTKSTPVLSADLFGDWREEVILVSDDYTSIGIYTTTIPTKYRFYTLMHDPIYRLGIAWQNVAYNQPPHTSFYIGDDMKPQQKPNIQIMK